MLTIPNMEIRNIFLTQIMEYFKKTVSENGEALEVRYCILQKEVQSNGSQINEKQIQKSSRTIEEGDSMVLLFTVCIDEVA